eukprot:g4834.t1
MEGSRSVPLLPLRNKTLFPGNLMRLNIGLSRSISLLESVVYDPRRGALRNRGKLLVMVSTLVPDDSSPNSSSNMVESESEMTKNTSSLKSVDRKHLLKSVPLESSDVANGNFGRVYEVGTVAAIVEVAHARNSQRNSFRYSVLVQGRARARIMSVTQSQPYYTVEVVPLPLRMDTFSNSDNVTLIENVRSLFRQLLDTLRNSDASKGAKVKLPSTSARAIDLLDAAATTNVHDLCNHLPSVLDVPIQDKQAILAESRPTQRLALLAELLARQVEVLRVSRKINAKIEDNLKRAQRQFYLRQQLKAIQEELKETNRSNSGSSNMKSSSNNDPNGGSFGSGDDSIFGEDGDPIAELKELSKSLEAANLPQDARTMAERAMRRIRQMQPAQPEYHVLRAYLDLMASLPWNSTSSNSTEEGENGSRRMTLKRVQDILDKDHCGLKDVKKRVVEYMAVCSLKNNLNAPILCLVGPPGVGKTSLGKSVARALGRPFFRIALGGMRDEAEIRGHRRTYIGALPGRIIQALQKVKVKDPVILLDEIDKVGRDMRGDPSAALLEVLDPAQNHSFTDHYLGTPFDLSQVLFMATANSMQTISKPLLDRMEVVQLSGYSWSEKMDIAREHLFPKQLRANGLDPLHLTIPPSVMLQIAMQYTREAGVRGLERTIGAVCRFAAVKLANWRDEHDGTQPTSLSVSTINESSSSAEEVAKEEEKEGTVIRMEKEGMEVIDSESVLSARQDILDGFVPVLVDSSSLQEILGPKKYDEEQSNCAVGLVPGAVFGLAWTAVGGVMLVVEAAVMPGNGQLKLTGQLGSVMKESVSTALSWIRLHASDASLGIPGGSLDTSKLDIHIHFPAAAVPKDGPSAGVAITTALVSALSGRCVRRDIAMTGEISLTGRVLPVGGIKEKLLAAHRQGCAEVFLPVKNERHLVELPDDVRNTLVVTLATEVRDVLDNAFPEQKGKEQLWWTGGSSHLPLEDGKADIQKVSKPGTGGSPSENAQNNIENSVRIDCSSQMKENDTLLADEAFDYLMSHL